MNEYQLSNNTRTYIEEFQCILNNMIKDMSSVRITNSISGSFITQMIPHHYAAISMSENLLRYTTCIPLQNIALNIISSQRKSIENMMNAYSKCQYCTNEPQELIHYEQNYDCIINNMFLKMSTACTDNNIDANFMREMIPHHKGAIYMSENALNFPLCKELVPLLNAIITSQKEGVEQMEQMLCNEKNCRQAVD